MIDKILKDVELICKNEYSGHDFSHILRVYKNACNILKHEQADHQTVKLAAILHDLDDYKIGGDEINLPIARKLLDKYQILEKESIIEIIRNMSYHKKTISSSLEEQIVRDADRLDAIGAIGIARTFAYGGNKNRSIEDSIQHFYDKLIHINESLVTKHAKKIGKQRHKIIVNYLKQIENEMENNEK